MDINNYLDYVSYTYIHILLHIPILLMIFSTTHKLFQVHIGDMNERVQWEKSQHHK